MTEKAQELKIKQLNLNIKEAGKKIDELNHEAKNILRKIYSNQEKCFEMNFFKIFKKIRLKNILFELNRNYFIKCEKIMVYQEILKREKNELAVFNKKMQDGLENN